MKHTKIKDLLNSTKPIDEVTVKGWVRTFRNNQFLAINDGSVIHNIQAVVDFENTAPETLKRLTTGAAVLVKGSLTESQGAGQKFEIQAKLVEILGDSDAEKFPMQPKKHSLEFLRENAHLRVRTNVFGAIMRVRSVLSFAIHQYFQEQGFVYVNTPIITGSDAEGAGEMFRVSTLPAFNNKKIEKIDFESKVNYSKFENVSKKYLANFKKELGENIFDQMNFLLSNLSNDITFDELLISKPNEINSYKRQFSKNQIDTLINSYVFDEINSKIKGSDSYNKIFSHLVSEIKLICKQNQWTFKRKPKPKKINLTSLSFFNLFEIQKIEIIDHSHDFFGKETNLTVSGQLEAETYAMALGQVYTFGPTFRAENSNTSRHLAEFWMVEPEVAFNDLDANMDLAEDFIQYVIKYTLDKCPDDLAFLNQRLADEEKTKPTAERSELGLLEKLNFVLENNFKRVSYTEAVDILRNSKPNKNKKFNYIIDEWGADLQSEHERFLVEKHFKCPVILYDYPAKIKAFYMRLNDDTPDDRQTVRAMDILFPGIGEIVGGSQREERLDVLQQKIADLGIDEKELWWYLDTRRFGTAVHSGFGLGFERLVLFVTGMTNIRDVIPFPRTPQNAEF